MTEIQDPDEIEKTYTQWRWRIFYSMFFGYVFYYLTRKSFTFVMPALIQDLGLDKAQLGLIATIWALTYGLSKFLTGIAVDRSSARYFMSFGLIASGLCNLCFGFCSSFWLLALFWGLNGWFQGFGWPPCACLLTQWYSRSERASWWSSGSASHNVGGTIVPLLTVFCAQWGWRFALYIPGIIGILMGLVLLNRLRDNPRSIGLPPIETYHNDVDETAKDRAEGKLAARDIIWNLILKNKVIWALAISYFFIYIIRSGINDWTALFLIETKGYSQLAANSSVSVFEVGGFCGTLLCGWVSDRIFNARRGAVNIFFALGIAISVILLWFIPKGYVLFDNIAMFMIGLTLFGPQMLIGVAAIEASHKKAAATATGFTGWWAYIGSAVAGYPIGRITQDWGWNGFFWMMASCSIIAVALLLPVWDQERKKIASATIPSLG